MILSRLAEAIRNQNWFTVLIEFLIVVLGIFVGLQVDSWNQARKDRALEQEYLSRLADDMRWNIEFLDTFEARYTAKAEVITLLKTIEEDALVSSEPEEMARWLTSWGWRNFPPVRDATFSELMSSGRISLLRDTGLRSELSIFYSRHKAVQQIFAEPYGDFLKMTFEILPGEVIYEIGQTGEFADLDTLRQSLRALVTNPQFEAAANAEINYCTSILYWIREYRRMAEEILDYSAFSSRH